MTKTLFLFNQGKKRSELKRFMPKRSFSGAFTPTVDLHFSFYQRDISGYHEVVRSPRLFPGEPRSRRDKCCMKWILRVRVKPLPHEKDCGPHRAPFSFFPRHRSVTRGLLSGVKFRGKQYRSLEYQTGAIGRQLPAIKRGRKLVEKYIRRHNGGGKENERGGVGAD